MTKVRTFICLVIVTITSHLAFAQTNIDEHEWTVTLKVVDEAGNPMPDANAKIWYHIPPPEGQSIAMTNKAGLTDSNGVFIATKHSGSIELECEAQKIGYYGSGLSHEFAKFKDNDPAKWNPTVTLMLKKITKPIAMYAKQATNLKLPVFDKSIGYDLMIGDWVGPYGKGVSTDIILEKEYYEKASNDYYSKVTLSFPKTGDGIQLFTPSDAEKGSDLRSPHEAPADGYQPELTRETSAHPGQPSKFEYDASRIYFFRVRTALDDEGKVVSAHYGKIYGDFMTITYYLNPTPNDRNIEFDPMQNLLRGLQSFKQVRQP